MTVTINGETYEIDRADLETLVGCDNPLADIARALLRLDESEQDREPSRAAAGQRATAVD